MIKIISYSRYLAETGLEPLPPTALFGPEMIDIIPQEILVEILDRVEGTTLEQGYPLTKFSVSWQHSIHWDKLSAGAQTALLIAYYSYSGTKASVWLGQCGENALAVCLKLLSTSELVTGILNYRPICNFPEREFPAVCDGNLYPHWRQICIER